MAFNEILDDDQLELAVGGLAAGQKERVFSVTVDSDEDYQRICMAVRKAGKSVSLTHDEEPDVCSLLASAALNQGVGKYEVTLHPGSKPTILKTL